MHASAQDGLELVTAVGVQVHGVQAGAKRQTAAHQAPVHIHFIATDEQPEVRNPYRLNGFRTEKRTVEQRCDPGQQIAVGGVFSAQLIDPAPWITHADHARRVAATDGGDTAILFDASMSEGEADRLDMESGLRKALERGEMSMHFQPQFSAWDRQLVGFEALMRWERNGKMQPAGKFIALAEETNLIIPLGEWAVDETCKALAALKLLGRTDCSIAVNLSSKQLHTGTLPAVIDNALKRHAVDANSLDVELTESSMMKDAERAVEALKAIRTLGVGLAVDDFGTGHSSLAYLTRLPLTTLKIDRSFVQDVHTSERSRAVASAIVALAANLHLSVVAEGVETEEQRQTLMALGCDLHQGWLYARAVPLDQALHIAAEDSARRSLSELAV